MKLVYNFKDKLYWIQNFLPYNHYKRIHDEVFKERKKLNYRSVKGEWDKNLTKFIGYPEKIEIDRKYFQFSETLIKHLPYVDVKGEFSYIVHKMTKSTGIEWHGDYGHKFGITYYINRRWNKDWGGELMFQDENDFGYIPVVGNSLLIVRTPVAHKVNPVLSPTIPRYTIQAFVRHDKINNQEVAAKK